MESYIWPKYIWRYYPQCLLERSYSHNVHLSDIAVLKIFFPYFLHNSLSNRLMNKILLSPKTCIWLYSNQINLCFSFPPKVEKSQIANSLSSSDHLQEQTYIQAPSYIQTQNFVNTAPSPIYCRTSPNASGYVPVSQPLHKKGSLRNGDVLKRSRVQTT